MWIFYRERGVENENIELDTNWMEENEWVFKQNELYEKDPMWNIQTHRRWI